MTTCTAASTMPPNNLAKPIKWGFFKAFFKREKHLSADADDGYNSSKCLRLLMVSCFSVAAIANQLHWSQNQLKMQ